MTETGQPLAAPTPAEFAEIFDFDDAGENSDVEDGEGLTLT